MANSISKLMLNLCCVFFDSMLDERFVGLALAFWQLAYIKLYVCMYVCIHSNLVSKFCVFFKSTSYYANL